MGGTHLPKVVRMLGEPTVIFLFSCYPFVTTCSPLFPLVPPCFPCYPLLPPVPFCSPLFPLVIPCYPLLPLVTSCYQYRSFLFVTPKSMICCTHSIILQAVPRCMRCRSKLRLARVNSRRFATPPPISLRNDV